MDSIDKTVCDTENYNQTTDAGWTHAVPHESLLEMILTPPSPRGNHIDGQGKLMKWPCSFTTETTPLVPTSGSCSATPCPPQCRLLYLEPTAVGASIRVLLWERVPGRKLASSIPGCPVCTLASRPSTANNQCPAFKDKTTPQPKQTTQSKYSNGDVRVMKDTGGK